MSCLGCLILPKQRHLHLCLLLLHILCTAESSTLRNAKAFVGRSFLYRLLDNGDEGSQLQVSEANQASLPPWLYYCHMSGSLMGVASETDCGTYIISVRGLPGSDGSREDVFALSVIDDASAITEVAAPLTRREDDAGAVVAETITCARSNTIAIAGLVTNVDLVLLGPRERIHLLNEIEKSVGVNVSHIFLFSVSSDLSQLPSAGGAWHRNVGWLMTGASGRFVLMNGPGNVDVATASRMSVASATPKTAVAWVVGCGNVRRDHIRLLDDLKSKATDGQLARAIGYDVIGWRVVNYHQQMGLADGSAGRERPPKLVSQSEMLGPGILSSGHHTVLRRQSSASFAGTSSLTFDKNPVYIHDNVKLTCSFPKEYVLTNVTIDAFKGSRKEGSLVCRVITGNTIGTGVLKGLRLISCPVYEPLSGNASVHIPASLVAGFVFNCTVGVHRNHVFYVFRSTARLLTIAVLPDAPAVYPNALVFNETDNITVKCFSQRGKPSAVLELLVEQKDGKCSERKEGEVMVSLSLPSPAKYWHNAKLMCRVKNHEFPSMTKRGIIYVHYITPRRETTLRVDASADSQILNCSADIESFPGALYDWSSANYRNVFEPTGNSGTTFNVTSGFVGKIKCTAVNNVTAAAVSITYDVVSCGLPLTSSTATIAVLAVILSTCIICC